VGRTNVRSEFRLFDSGKVHIYSVVLNGRRAFPKRRAQAVDQFDVDGAFAQVRRIQMHMQRAPFGHDSRFRSRDTP